MSSIGDVVFGAGVRAFSPFAMAIVLRTMPAIHDLHSEFLSVTPAVQGNPSIASDGLDFMAVFREETGASKGIKSAALLRASGAPVDQPTLLANDTRCACHRSWNSVYLVAWADASGVFAERLSNQGIVIDSQPMKLASGPYSTRPDVAWNGKSFLVAWPNAGIAAALIGEDGILSPAQMVASDGSMEPRVAWNGRVFLVIYGVPQGCYFDPCPSIRARTEVVRIASNGMPIDNQPLVIDAPRHAIFAVNISAQCASAETTSW